MDEARVQTPDMADVDGDGLILRVEADNEEMLPVEPIQEFFHERITVIRSVDGPSLIADAPFFDEFDSDDVDTLCRLIRFHRFSSFGHKKAP